MTALVIDDEPEVLKELASALRTMVAPDKNAYEVTEAGDHKTAQKLLREHRYDVVITDMIMGTTEKEGLTIAEILRGKSPITIVATAHPKFPVCVEAMRMGVWDYLEKQPADKSTDVFENLEKSLKAAWEYRGKYPNAGRMHPDMAWAEEHFAELAQDHPGRYVAVLDQKVADSDENYEKLMDRLKAKYPMAYPSIISLPAKEDDGKEYV